MERIKHLLSHGQLKKRIPIDVGIRFFISHKCRVATALPLVSWGSKR